MVDDGDGARNDDADDQSDPPTVTPGVPSAQFQKAYPEDEPAAERYRYEPHSRIPKKPSHEPGLMRLVNCWA